MDDRLIEYILEHVDKNFERTDAKILHLEEKVDRILAFKWKLVGGSLVLVAIITVTMNVAAIVFSK